MSYQYTYPSPLYVGGGYYCYACLRFVVAGHTCSPSPTIYTTSTAYADPRVTELEQRVAELERKLAKRKKKKRQAAE